MAAEDLTLRAFGSVFTSPRLLSVFSSKGFSESDSVKSPTSILDNKPFSCFGNPFWSDHNNKNPSSKSSNDPFFLEINKHPWEKKKLDSGVGLGIVDALNDEEHNQKFSNPTSTRMVLFGSQLKIQIPPVLPILHSSAAHEESSPKSPSDFGIKTRASSHIGKSPFGSANSGLEATSIATPSPRVFTGCLSASEMECSEDYTCVITHGPNPRTTHIFDNCIVENCCGVLGFSTSKKETSSPTKRNSSSPTENLSFLSFCHTCKKDLEQGKDIYIYRGEKAFCSHECRNQEILIDEQIEKSGLGSSDEN